MYDATGMSGVIKHRVKIGTCSGPAEAAFVRSVFDAHGLEVVINGEQHGYAMGGLGGFVRLDILVDADHAEEAVALLDDIRAGAQAVGDDADVSGDDAIGSADADADADGVWHAPAVPDAAPAAALAAADDAAHAEVFDLRRRRTGIVLLFSVLVGFGAGHAAVGAWGRGIAIFLLNVFGFWGMATGHPWGGWILFGARFVDMFGAMLRVWNQKPG